MDALHRLRSSVGALLLALSVSCTFGAPEETPAATRQQGLDEAILDPGATPTTVRPAPPARPLTGTFRWETVANKNDLMPNSLTPQQPAGRTFNSFNQPSVNSQALVVFRARSRGGPPLGAPTRGIYARPMALPGTPPGPIATVAGGSSQASRGATAVPAPNNLSYPPAYLPTAFIEFPSIPRIAVNADAVATRGMHQPVWTYDLFDPDTGEVAETRVGTTGVYVNLDARHLSASPLLSGATRLGVVPGFGYYAVPGLPGSLPFDVFPGAPAITDDGFIAFKGNYPPGETGVFFRKVSPGSTAAVEQVATSRTPIPDLASCESSSRTTFGSTAPPSAAVDSSGVSRLVFVGLDNEQAPSCGGIYLAPLRPNPPLTPVVPLGAPVPGVAGARFSLLGEGLSFDGRFISFWAAWGAQARTLRLYCPEEGNQDRLAFCNHTGAFHPVTGTLQGDVNSVCDDATDGTERCYQERQVPVNQGIFLFDLRTGRTSLAARTQGGGLTDFVFWVYSGRVPGTGGGEETDTEEEGEPARWRSSAFSAVAARGASAVVVFKARSATLDPVTRLYENKVDGLYLARLPGRMPLVTVLDTTMAGTVLDPQAVDPATQAALPVVELGLERDALRGRWLVVNASMGAESEAEETASMAGIYLTTVP